jgi:nitrogen regulatory protein P-II 2
MKTYPMKLITIIGETHARTPLCRLFEEVGAHGFTVFPVEGKGSQGLRDGGMPEYANLQFEVIVQAATAELLLDRLQEAFFPSYAMVAHVTDIGVLRADKF